jgi:hypothetical protein
MTVFTIPPDRTNEGEVFGTSQNTDKKDVIFFMLFDLEGEPVIRLYIFNSEYRLSCKNETQMIGCYDVISYDKDKK